MHEIAMLLYAVKIKLCVYPLGEAVTVVFSTETIRAHQTHFMWPVFFYNFILT